MSIEPVLIEVFPSGFAKSRVPVTIRADIRPITGEELRALASSLKTTAFKDLLREETSRLIETSITLDELNARPPAAARDSIQRALDRRLLSEGWRTLSLDLTVDWKMTGPELKIAEKFGFPLGGLAREWTGEISFLAYPSQPAKFFASGISAEGMAGYVRDRAKTIAVRSLSAHNFESLLPGYAATKTAIRNALESLLEACGYALGGFNLTTTLPIEALAGVIRTRERQNVEFVTRYANRKVRLTYHVDYGFPDLSKVQEAVATNEDVPQSVAAAVDQALRDQLRQTELLDFYFQTEVAEKGTTPVRDMLVAAIQRRLAAFGAQIRSALLVREDDDVLRKIDEMVQPAQQGAIPPCDVPHPRLDDLINVRKLVFLVGNFSKEYFYQFVVTKPRIDEIIASVKSHCEQWLADVEPALMFRIPNLELCALFEKFVEPRIQREFGVTICIANFILGAHRQVLRPRSPENHIGSELREWEQILQDLRVVYRERFVAGDPEAATIKEQIKEAQETIERLRGELEGIDFAAQRQIATEKPKRLMPGSQDRTGGDNGDEPAAVVGR